MAGGDEQGVAWVDGVLVEYRYERMVLRDDFAVLLHHESAELAVIVERCSLVVWLSHGTHCGITRVFINSLMGLEVADQTGFAVVLVVKCCFHDLV